MLGRSRKGEREREEICWDERIEKESEKLKERWGERGKERKRYMKEMGEAKDK